MNLYIHTKNGGSYIIKKHQQIIFFFNFFIGIWTERFPRGGCRRRRTRFAAPVSQRFFPPKKGQFPRQSSRPAKALRMCSRSPSPPSAWSRSDVSASGLWWIVVFPHHHQVRAFVLAKRRYGSGVRRRLGAAGLLTLSKLSQSHGCKKMLLFFFTSAIQQSTLGKRSISIFYIG